MGYDWYSTVQTGAKLLLFPLFIASFSAVAVLLFPYVVPVIGIYGYALTVLAVVFVILVLLRRVINGRHPCHDGNKHPTRTQNGNISTSQ